jgi:hypothetical protein
MGDGARSLSVQDVRLPPQLQPQSPHTYAHRSLCTHCPVMLLEDALEPGLQTRSATTKTDVTTRIVLKSRQTTKRKISHPFCLTLHSTYQYYYPIKDHLSAHKPLLHHPTHLIRLHRFKSPHNSRKPNIRHLNIPRIIRVHSIPQIRRTKPRILIDHPNGRFRLIQPLRPRHNRRVELLDLSVIVSDANRDDLSDLS